MALAILAMLGAALATPAAAGPARFVYEQCDSALPGGGVPPGLRYTVNPGVALAPWQNCATPGGSIGITETGHTEATFSFWTVPLPVTPGGYIETLTLSGQACNLGAGNDHAFAYQQGWPGSCTPTQRVFHVANAPSAYHLFGSEMWLFLNCDGNYAPGCEAGPTVSARDIAELEVDPVPPSLGAVSGGLLGGGTIRGHQSLAVEAEDKGGGLSSVFATVNGLPAAQKNAEDCAVASVNNSSYVGTVALSPSPCPSAMAASWTLDTETYPFHEGENVVEVCAADFSTLGDPNMSCSKAQIVDVDNSCTDSPVGGGELLSAQFARSNRETLTVGYGREAEVVGQLQTNAGDPVPGATLCVKMATLGAEARPANVGTVTTDANGHYDYKVSPGPDREVVIGYRHDASQVARDVRYYAHARPSLKLAPAALSNGERVKFWGKLPGPRSGRRVVIVQANVPGSPRWITFRKVTTNRDGGFSTGYRFNSTTRRTRYRFRALVPRQAGYPWVEGSSKPADVLVRP